MKRPYYLRRNRSGVPWWAYGIAIIFVLVILGIRLFLPNVFVTLMTPLWNFGSSLSRDTSSFTANFANKQQLQKQNADLEAQIQELTSENAVLGARAQDLTKLLGGQSTVPGGIAAGVLAAPPESPYDTLVVAAGSNDGIQPNALVYSAGGIPVGTVSTVHADSSDISLLSMPGRTISGWVGTNRTPITLTGMGAGAFNATVTASTSISVGDTVYVPGPGALPIGTVVRVNTDPSSPTPIVYVQPLINIFSLTWVEVSRSS